MTNEPYLPLILCAKCGLSRHRRSQMKNGRKPNERVTFHLMMWECVKCGERRGYGNR